MILPFYSEIAGKSECHQITPALEFSYISSPSLLGDKLGKKANTLRNDSIHNARPVDH